MAFIKLVSILHVTVGGGLAYLFKGQRCQLVTLCHPHFKFLDIRTLWRSALSARVSECQKLKNTTAAQRVQVKTILRRRHVMRPRDWDRK